MIYLIYLDNFTCMQLFWYDQEGAINEYILISFLQAKDRKSGSIQPITLDDLTASCLLSSFLSFWVKFDRVAITDLAIYPILESFDIVPPIPISKSSG